MDCLEMLRNLPDNSIDSLVTDPPYGLSKDDPTKIQEVIKQWATGNDEAIIAGKGFMGKEWDAFVPPPIIWKEVYRVLKPGAYGLVFAGTRTQDLMSISLRFAGFQIKDVVEWLYFTGFPKSHNISKAIDRKAGKEREVIGMKPYTNDASIKGNNFNGGDYERIRMPITAPNTPEAKKWDGFGTQLKPSHEPAILIQKPISEKTIADNILKWGTGGLNIDETRIGNENISTHNAPKGTFAGGEWDRGSEKIYTEHEGRFPANSITQEPDQFYSKYFNITPAEISKKAGKKDRNQDYRGNEIKGNKHPCVKPVALMEHLIKMITPPDGVTLDPFMGSGSTIVAAKKLAYENEKYTLLSFIGCELSEEYFEIAEARIYPNT